MAWLEKKVEEPLPATIIDADDNIHVVERALRVEETGELLMQANMALYRRVGDIYVAIYSFEEIRQNG